MRRIRVLSIVLAVTSACSVLSPDRKRTERQPAYISYAGFAPLLQAPDTVPVGTAFPVAVRTFGGGCVDQGDTETAIGDHIIEIRPFDIFTTHLPDGWACTDELRLYTHSASVRLDAAGTWTVRAIGRSGADGTPATAERSVIAR
jgi:hypothetical protein